MTQTTDMTSLYIHIPFCKRKCKYCSFYSIPDYSSQYIDKILQFVKFYGGKTIDTVYIGGGTPSVMPTADILRLFEGIHKHFNVTKDAEITVEVNPESVNADFLCALKQAGVNRISLGVQSFDDNELDAIGRLHNGKRAKQAITLVKEHGFDNISCDLIFGLPKSTLQSFENNVKTLVELDIPHISCYNLQVEKGTPLYDEKIAVPDEQTQEKMYYSACDILKGAGYTHYEISNYAKDGFGSRHNSGYWQDKDYIGLGPSAHSKTGDMRASFDADIDKFLQKTDFEFDSIEKITDNKFENIMLSLRTDSGIPLCEIEKSRDFAKRLVSGGFADIIDDRLVLTDKGFYLSNTIITEIANLEEL